MAEASAIIVHCAPWVVASAYGKCGRQYVNGCPVRGPAKSRFPKHISRRCLSEVAPGGLSTKTNNSPGQDRRSVITTMAEITCQRSLVLTGQTVYSTNSSQMISRMRRKAPRLGHLFLNVRLFSHSSNLGSNKSVFKRASLTLAQARAGHR